MVQRHRFCRMIQPVHEKRFSTATEPSFIDGSAGKGWMLWLGGRRNIRLCSSVVVIVRSARPERRDDGDGVYIKAVLRDLIVETDKSDQMIKTGFSEDAGAKRGQISVRNPLLKMIGIVENIVCEVPILCHPKKFLTIVDHKAVTVGEKLYGKGNPEG